MRPPIVWSVAGSDSGGGAGLSADQRAADAFGAHLCPVVSAVTAQHSRAVERVAPLPPELLDAQLAALARDMPPRAIKTGLLGGPAQVACVARWVDRMRAEHGPVPLVVDPVLGATTGARFADEATVRALRETLLPRATLVVPNRREAAVLARREAGKDGREANAAVRDDARALRAAGAGSVCVTGGDAHGALALDWLDDPDADGWLALPRVRTPHDHGTGCTFASAAAAAMALGFVAADAVVLAKMASAAALRHGRAAGAGAGPVRAVAGFGTDATLLPAMGFGPAPPAWPTPGGLTASGEPVGVRAWAGDGPGLRPLGVYAIVDGAARVAMVLAAGVRTVQLRIKSAAPERLRDEIVRSLDACRAAGARLFVNDHWQLARECGAPGAHLGQEDLAGLGDAGRAALAASGLALGVSSHSLWELARARGLAPDYIACGPVWPTTTKVMPWRAQGLGNLAWWCAIAGRPVVAIGGVLTPAQVRLAASAGASGVCVVRAIGDSPAATVPEMRQAYALGAADPPLPVPQLPAPSLAARA